jgi:hypothetical protein
VWILVSCSSQAATLCSEINLMLGEKQRGDNLCFVYLVIVRKSNAYQT